MQLLFMFIYMKNLLINGAVVYLRSKKTGFNLMIGNRGNVSAEECKDSDYGECHNNQCRYVATYVTM